MESFEHAIAILIRKGEHMKYGESIFDIVYLLFAIIAGCLILRKSRSAAVKQMGAAALILGCGDAFHLIPRVLNYFVNADFTAALGIGKFITSISMTVFYVMLYEVWAGYYQEKKTRSLTCWVWGSALVRIILCLFPQNGWIENSSGMTWGIIRNIPFVLLGGIICWLYFRNRNNDRLFRFFWIYICLSFLFYIPVAVAAGVLPLLGMLMLPKTICYILMIWCFIKALKSEQSREKSV